MKASKSIHDKEKKKEIISKNIFLFCALISVLITFSIIASLIFNTLQFFQEISLFDFLTGTEWTPLFADAKYGILPLICGT